MVEKMYQRILWEIRPLEFVRRTSVVILVRRWVGLSGLSCGGCSLCLRHAGVSLCAGRRWPGTAGVPHTSWSAHNTNTRNWNDLINGQTQDGASQDLQTSLTNALWFLKYQNNVSYDTDLWNIETNFDASKKTLWGQNLTFPTNSTSSLNSIKLAKPSKQTW